MAEPTSYIYDNQPEIKDRKQKVRLWFEFYKLALQDSTLTDLVNESREYYANWGDVTDIKFDPWWADHKHLFPPVEVQVINGKQAPNTAHTLSVAIPLNQALHQTIKQLTELVKQAQKQDAESDSSTYAFTKSSFNGKLVNQILELYRYYLQANKPPINGKFVTGYIEDYLKPKKRQKWVPEVFKEIYGDYVRGSVLTNTDSFRKSLTRYIKTADNLKRAAAEGKFPGKIL